MEDVSGNCRLTASQNNLDLLINFLDRMRSCIEKVERTHDENHLVDTQAILIEINDIGRLAHAVWPEKDEDGPDKFADIMQLKAEIHNASLRCQQLVGP